VFIADNGNNRVREVLASSGNIVNFAGSSAGTPGNTGDGLAATSATLHFPRGLAFDPSGNLFIADTTNNRVREVFGLAAGAFFTDGSNQLWVAQNGTFTNTGGFATVFSGGVDLAGNAECWFLDGSSQLWKWDNGTFTNTGGFAQKIAAGRGFVAFTDGLNQLNTFTDGGGGFKNTGGFASRFTAGFDRVGHNQIVFADGSNQLFTFNALTSVFTNTGGFTNLFVAGQDVAGNNEIWFTDASNQIWRLDGGVFHQTADFALTITGSAGGTMFFSDGINQIYQLTDAGVSTNTGGFASRLSGSSTLPALFFFDGINQIWMFTGGVFTPTGGFGTRLSAF
jgi:hypothetical protein